MGSFWSRLWSRNTTKKAAIAPVKKRDPYALHILHPLGGSEYGSRTNIDIIAVHGLGGDPWDTWTDKSTGNNWLKDFLPNVLPNARIMTFGYNSQIKFSNSVSTIDDFAKELLNRIRIEHQQGGTDMCRPLIFICHSLGGIVVKKALILAHEGGERFDFIKKSCRGIIFLGTPHRGSKVADLGKILSTIVNSLTLSAAIRSPLLNDLRSKSGVLQTISRQFVMRSKDLQIISFYETEVMVGGSLSVLVVDEDSATIGTANETTIPINANHHTMCKFPDEECPKYNFVKGTILEMTGDVLGSAIEITQEEGLHDQILEWLNPDSIESSASIYESRLGERRDGTCNWFWKYGGVKNWDSGSKGSSVLWVHGPPGLGKSVLCSSIISKLSGEKSMAYFFCVSRQQSEPDPNSNVSKINSRELILRNLIVQLLVGDDAYRVPNQLKVLFKRHKRSRPIGWSVLKEILQSILSIHPRSYIIIDGLDEIDEPGRDNRNQLEKLLEILDLDCPAIVKWLLVSQKTKAVTEAMNRRPKSRQGRPTTYRELDLAEVDAELRYEIKTMMEATVKEGFPNLLSNQEVVVISLLVGLADGNFLCAGMLLGELDGCTSVDNLIKKIINYKPGLENHYLRALRKLASVDNSSWLDMAKKTLMFVTLAMKPLVVREVKAALSVSAESTGEDNGEQGVFEDVIEKLCLPLVRVCPKKRTMKLVHYSVRAFLMKQLGNSESWDITGIEDFFIDEKKGNTAMALFCLSYLTNDRYCNFPPTDLPRESPESVTTVALTFDNECEKDSNSFLKYAAIFWHSHADEAEVTVDLFVAAKKFLLSPTFITCLRVRSIYAPYHFGTFVSSADSSVAFADTIPGWLTSAELLPGTEGKEISFQYYSFIKEWGHVLSRYPGEVERCLVGTLGNIFFSPIRVTAEAHFLGEGGMHFVDVDSPNFTSIADLQGEGWVLALKSRSNTLDPGENRPRNCHPGCTLPESSLTGSTQYLDLWHYDPKSKYVPQLQRLLSDVAGFTSEKPLSPLVHLNCCEHPQKDDCRAEWPSNMSPLVASPALDYAILNGYLFGLRKSGNGRMHDLQNPLIEFKFSTVLCTPLGIALGTRGKYLGIGVAWECEKCVPDGEESDDEDGDDRDSDNENSSGADSSDDEDIPVFAGTAFVSEPITSYTCFKFLIYDSSKEKLAPLYELVGHCKGNSGGNGFRCASPVFHPKKSLVAWAPGPGKIIFANFKTRVLEQIPSVGVSRNSDIVARELHFSPEGNLLYEIMITLKPTGMTCSHRGEVLLTVYRVKDSINPDFKRQRFTWKLRYWGSGTRGFTTPTTTWTADSVFVSFSNMGLSVCRIDLLPTGARLYMARTTLLLPTSMLQRSVRYIPVDEKDAIVVLEGSVGYEPSLISAKGLVDWDECDWESKLNLDVTGGGDVGVFYECDEPSFTVPVRSDANWTERKILECS